MQIKQDKRHWKQDKSARDLLKHKILQHVVYKSHTENKRSERLKIKG